MLPREVKFVLEVKCFELSNGLDIVLYKKHTLYNNILSLSVTCDARPSWYVISKYTDHIMYIFLNELLQVLHLCKTKLDNLYIS